MRQPLLGIISLFLLSSSALADTGMANIKSAHDVSTTADRLEKALLSKGMTIFTRIDHAAGAIKAGKTLRPTELVIFGNPKVGTPLMQCQQSIAIDLPQKALIWEDDSGQVWFSYNTPAYLASRHNIEGCDQALAKIEQALSNFAQAAVAK